MNRIIFCCLLLAGIFIHTNSFSQCTPDPNCDPSQIICPSVLASGCENVTYTQTITIAVPDTVQLDSTISVALVSIQVNDVVGLPPGLTYSCNPGSCLFPANGSGCVLVEGLPTTAGTYPITVLTTVSANVGFPITIDTPFTIGAIIINEVDCNGDCGGTASFDGCGICSGGNTGLLPNCDDANPCTLDDCDGLGGCINTPLTCDDGDPCTTDSCDAGNCLNTPIVCDDLNACTDDACVAGVCEFTPNGPQLAFDFQNICEGDTTFITNLSTGVDAGAVYSIDVNNNGTIDLTLPASQLPADSALFIPITGNIDFTVYVVNSNGCADTLQGSILVADCDDGDACTIDSCSGAQCFNTPIICDDQNACTDDACVGGVCEFTSSPQLAFDFQNICEGDTTFITNLSTGVDSGAIYSIDVNNNGTIDLTLPASQLPTDSALFIPITGNIDFTVYVVNSNGCADTLQGSILVADCDDGDPCTIDSCSGAQCFNTPIVCDDQNACTDDACVGGVCEFTNSPQLAFDFQNICEGDTTFITNLSSGVDSGAVYSIDVNNNGTIDLTLPASQLPTDSALFIPITGNIDFTVYVVNSNGCADTLQGSILVADCDDADACTVDSCSGAQCFNTPIVCDDLDACTTDSCVGGLCEFTAIICNDNDSCTNDFCDLGVCVFDSIPGCVSVDPCDTLVCDDGNACTDDECVSGVCEFTPSGPQLAFDFQNICDGDTTFITNLSTGVDSGAVYSIDVNNNGTIDLSLPASQLPTDSALFIPITGNIDFTVYVVNSNGCADTLLGSILVADCDDADACTVDSCSGAQCFNTPIVCDDLDACTTDSCVGGLCEFTAIICNDNDSCTNDFCDLGVCVFDSIPGCVSVDPCDTLVCDDSDLCTTDACVAGVCEFTPVVCTDGDGCTTDSCIAGACVFTPLICDDSIACTDDACVAGACQFTPIVCDDTDACTTDSCVNGICEFTPVVCADNDSCTIDACVAGVCEFTPVNCDDQDSCTVDVCQGGQCLNIPVDCADGDPCTNDLCQGGNCINTPVDCSDGDPCTNDLCVNGQCFNQPLDCDDGNPCTTDFCDTTGTCQNTPIAGCCLGNADCDDANGCTDDVCNGGVCLYIATCCDDNDSCTIDVCDPANGACQFIPLFCDDGDLCTTDGCDNGVCTFTPINCDDNDLCTTDSCANGVCLHTPQNCDDGDACTTDFCDSLGVCQNVALLCDDADLCTNDSCVQGICVFTPVLCDDGDLCTADKCVLGTCVFTQNDCDDSDVCTDDICIGGTCFNNPIANCCVDSTQCDDADVCTDNLCVNNQCQFTTTFTGLTIVERSLPLFCQGSGVILDATTPAAVSYAWSTTESTPTIQVAASGTYSVTATNAAGCVAVDSITVTLDASALLSSYVIVAQKEIDLSTNTVLSGGVGVTRDHGKVKVRNSSVVTAAGTFVKADNIAVSGGSTVTTLLTTEASLTLPPFETNPNCNLGQDLNIASTSTVTLNGNLYNGVTIGKGSTVTFTAADINLENLHTKDDVTIIFTAPCVKVRVCKKFQLGNNNTFNQAGSDVVLYVAQDVTIGGGTDFTGDIYMTTGKMTVMSASAGNPNNLTGLFMVNILQAGGNTNWNQNPNCDPACNPVQPVLCQGNDRRVVSLTLVNANTDQDMGTINDGDIIDICQTPVNIRANVCDDPNIESVRFLLNGNNYRMENLPFYTIAGDNNGNYLPWTIAPGVYTIRAVPYAGNNGTGTAGTAHEVTVTIICTAARMSNPNQTMGTDMIDRSIMLKGYPNIFSDKLNIEFSLPQQGRVTLDIIDIAGNKIAELFNGMAEGEKMYKFEFNADNNAGGIVIYRLQTENGVYYDKAVIVR